MKKPYMVIDIVVIVATTAVISTTAKDRDKADYFSVSLLRFLRFLQVLRVLRMDRQQGQWGNEYPVMRNAIFILFPFLQLVSI